jgi:hypothetical protein
MGHEAGCKSDGARHFYWTLRPVALLVTLIVQDSPFAWLVAHFWSQPPAAFLKAWFLESESFMGFWLASSFVIWASCIPLLVLARLAPTRPLVLRIGASHEEFGRRATEATLIWTLITIFAVIFWYGLAGW